MRQPGLGDLLFTDLLVLDHCPQDRDQLEIFTRADLQEDVGRFDAFGFADIDQDHRAILAAARQKFAFLHQGVLGEVTRMALRRIASPVDNEIGSVLDLAQSTCDFATQLGGYFSRTMSQRGVAVEQSTKMIGHRHTFSLRFARRVAHPVHQRHVGVVKMVGSRLDRFVNGRFLAIDQRVGIFVLGRMIEKPSFAEHAGTLGLVNLRVIGMQLDIVADTATEGAGCMIDDFQIHVDT